MLTTGHLFSGAGGDTHGAIAAQCHPLWAIDNDKWAASIYRYQFPSILLLEKDIREISPVDLPKVDIIIGGTPCPDFSIGGKRAGLNGDRGKLFWEFIRFLSILTPDYFVFENVAGILLNKCEFLMILNAFEYCGYYCQYFRKNASRIVPQNRDRIFIVGFRKLVKWKSYKNSEIKYNIPSLQSIIGRNNKFICRAGDKDRIYTQIAPTITGGGKRVGFAKYKIESLSGRRPITPNEVEQLMGWPINSTLYGTNLLSIYRISNTQRIRALGNSIVPKEITELLNDLKDGR
ncbi:MAG TPA: hypothetical protein DDW51_05495 [Cyanobacteria bacterium UBA11367]|nr:hypothetical protein [Cyanobacteria bacterium UBA11367]